MLYGLISLVGIGAKRHRLGTTLQHFIPQQPSRQQNHRPSFPKLQYAGPSQDQNIFTFKNEVNGLEYLLRFDAVNSPSDYARPTGSNSFWLDDANKLLNIAVNSAYAAYRQNFSEFINKNHLLSQLVKLENTFHCGGMKTKALGYVAVSEVEKLIVVAFRGTCGLLQLWSQIKTAPSLRSPFEGGGLVMDYVVQACNSLQPQVKDVLIQLNKKFPEYKILFCGHSLGGSIAQVTASRIVHKGLFASERVHLITFGMPRIGTKEHAEAIEKLVPRYIRVVNKQDVIPVLPPWLHHAGCKAVVEKPTGESGLYFLVQEHRVYLGYSTKFHVAIPNESDNQ